MAPVFLKIEPMSMRGPQEALYGIKVIFKETVGPLTVKGWEKDSKTGCKCEVEYEALTSKTPHHHRNDDTGKMFDMFNQGKVPPAPEWKFGVLYGTVETSKEADEAIKVINGTGYDRSIIKVSRVADNEVPELVPHN